MTTVKELIDQLKKFDGDLPVVLNYTDPFNVVEESIPNVSAKVCEAQAHVEACDPSCFSDADWNNSTDADVKKLALVLFDDPDNAIVNNR